jgi:predicted Zn-dependent peptidase
MQFCDTADCKSALRDGGAPTLLGTLATLAVWLGATTLTHAVEPKLETKTLTNGIRLAAIEIPGSTNVSLFTFLPMGLASDGPSQAQWSHLVEHMVITSTLPDDLAHGNAETSPDGMRLDYYGSTGDWTEGLGHHRRWLEGVPFTEARLAMEKPKVISECEFTAKNLATHKFALAAWSHGYRHGRTQVDLKGDVLHATLGEIQRYRDAHLAVLDKTTVCLIGGVEAKTFFAEAEKQLGRLKSQATPAAAGKLHPGKLDLIWDLEARHLVLAWPMPEVASEDYAALMAAAQWLLMRCFSDQDLKQRTGMVFAGTDLFTPEGNFFYLSASLKPETTFDEVEKRIRGLAASISSDSGGAFPLAMVGPILANSLGHVPDPDIVLKQAPPQMARGMLEANLGLQLFVNVSRYGAQREALAKKAGDLTAAKIQQAAVKYLGDAKAWVATIQPEPKKK